MNTVKYYRKKLNGMVEVKAVKVTQTNAEIYRYRTNKLGQTVRLKQKHPTVAQADRAMLRRGFTRQRLWTTQQAAA